MQKIVLIDKNSNAEKQNKQRTEEIKKKEQQKNVERKWNKILFSSKRKKVKDKFNFLEKLQREK